VKTNEHSGVTRMSRFASNPKVKKSLDFSDVGVGQGDPRHCPYPEPSECPLGAPLNIGDVATLLGCSPWTVRQRYLPQGLPHFRASASGKFVFFRRQILDWVLERQRKEEWK
jgi:hypothetical protein